uniref:Seminal fluid protein HACP028 n=1 Tax=Heliconius erato TaxID=33431 RepID=D9HQ42_HELEA|nr:seminal fluid protein HACP028 [Heliconius erato]
MKLLFYCAIGFVLIVNVLSQVPYDYIPLGRRRDRPHPSDVNLDYERLFPSRRKYLD